MGGGDGGGEKCSRTVVDTRREDDTLNYAGTLCRHFKLCMPPFQSKPAKLPFTKMPSALLSLASFKASNHHNS